MSKLSKCTKGSNNRHKQKIKIARLHEKVANCRKDFLHKRTRNLVDNCDAVIIEDLNMQAISQCLNFGKSVHSSKKCNECGEINEGLQLSDREWVCKSCGCVIDRDYNAAKNIRDEGLRLLGLTA